MLLIIQSSSFIAPTPHGHREGGGGLESPSSGPDLHKIQQFSVQEKTLEFPRLAAAACELKIVQSNEKGCKGPNTASTFWLGSVGEMLGNGQGEVARGVGAGLSLKF